MKIKKSQFADLGLLLYIIYAFFSDLIGALASNTIYRYCLWGGALLFVFVAASQRGAIYVTKRMAIVLTGVVIFVIARNQAFTHSDYLTTIRWMFCFLFSFLAINLRDKLKKSVTYILYIGIIHVIATYIFILIPSLYSKMYLVWGYWPSGTSYGEFGYKAGLTNHYSHNGIVLAVTYLALFSMIFVLKNYSEEIIKKRKITIYNIMFLLTFWSVILTTKRAHLLFGILAMVIVYYFCKPEKVGSKTFKLLIIVIIGIIAVSIAGNYIPAISDILLRFSSSVNEDSNMQSRFSFWELAMGMFLKKPILGWGWFGFRYQYNLYLYDPSIRSARYELLDCHNVYLQVLSENGIVGFAIYMTIVMYILYWTFSMLRKSQDIIKKYNMLTALTFSACMQVFYLLYSMTGNCLYDITSAFYMLAVSVALSCKLILRRDRRECK